MTDQPSGRCACCHRRDPESGLTCQGCRSRLSGWLREIPGLYADLEARDDALRSSAGHGWVTGSREAPVPIRVDAVDLTLPARPAPRPDPVWQLGHRSAASTLDAWVRDWRRVRDRGERLPVPQVPVLCSWLFDRLDWACDHHYAVDEFSTDLGHLRSTLRRELGLFDVPESKVVPCRSCELLTLERHNGSDWISCANPSCGLLLSPDEYAAWTALQYAHLRGPG